MGCDPGRHLQECPEPRATECFLSASWRLLSPKALKKHSVGHSEPGAERHSKAPRGALSGPGLSAVLSMGRDRNFWKRKGRGPSLRSPPKKLASHMVTVLCNLPLEEEELHDDHDQNSLNKKTCSRYGHGHLKCLFHLYGHHSLTLISVVLLDGCSCVLQSFREEDFLSRNCA